MASQAGMSRQGTVAQAHPERIDTSGRLLCPTPREEVRTQPQLLTPQELDTINKKLLAASQTIDMTRQRLYETRFVADSTLQELEQERQMRKQYTDAYKEVHVQYGKKVGEAHQMATRCVSLHSELAESQMLISDYKSSFEEFEKKIASGKAQIENTAKELERRTSELQNAKRRIQELEKEVDEAVEREQLVDQTISELEEENADLSMALQRFHGLEDQKGQLNLAIEKNHNLEKEKEDAAQEHRAKINQMIAREALAEQKIAAQQQEMEELIQELQEQTTTTENSAEGKSGKRCAASPARGRASKYRKCKDTRNMGDEDTTDVQNGGFDFS